MGIGGGYRQEYDGLSPKSICVSQSTVSCLIPYPISDGPVLMAKRTYTSDQRYLLLHIITCWPRVSWTTASYIYYTIFICTNYSLKMMTMMHFYIIHYNYIYIWLFLCFFFSRCWCCCFFGLKLLFLASTGLLQFSFVSFRSKIRGLRFNNIRRLI